VTLAVEEVQLTGEAEGVPPMVLEPEYSLLTVSAHKRLIDADRIVELIEKKWLKKTVGN
jgi:hypothetical protein